VPADPLAPASFTLPALRIDTDGDWWDGDGRITHPGLVASLVASLRQDADGYFIQTRVRVPVQVEEAPFVVTRVARVGDALRAWLSDGSEEAIDPATLRVSERDVPRCVTSRGFDARLSRAAAFQLLALLDGDGPSGPGVLRVGARTYRIPGLRSD